jgi:hypothetical protein
MIADDATHKRTCINIIIREKIPIIKSYLSADLNRDFVGELGNHRGNCRATFLAEVARPTFKNCAAAGRQDHRKGGVEQKRLLNIKIHIQKPYLILIRLRQRLDMTSSLQIQGSSL